MATAKEEQSASQWVGIAVEIRGRCLACGNPVMVNAAVKELTCPSCLGTVAMPRGDWWEVLERIVEDGAHGLGKSGVSLPLGQLAEPSLRWFPQAPLCIKCQAPLELGGALARGVGSSIACAKCGEKASLRSLQPDLTGMSVLAVGEDPDQTPSGLDGPRPPAAVEPVRFPCPACGASLPVDGSKRTVDCEFCHTKAFLPDDLWRRFHPVKVIRRWHLWADVGPLRAREAMEQAAREAEDDRMRADEVRRWEEEARRKEEDKARRLAAEAAEAQRQAQKEAEEAHGRRKTWRFVLLLAIIGLALGLAFSLASIALDRLAGIIPGLAFGSFLLAEAVSGASLFSAGYSFGQRVRWWHYVLPATILLMSLVGGIWWFVILEPWKH